MLFLKVPKGSIVAFVGPNGAGKTTIFYMMMGLIAVDRGRIDLDGHDISRFPMYRRARLGVGYCPEERGIFTSLSCEQNLMLPPTLADGGMSVEEIYTMFPNLKERRNSPGGRLSGGEQQMLAMARILRTGAKLLLLDEITEGLAPVIVEKLGQAVTDLRQRGFTIVLVEQNFRFAAPLADRHYVIEHGQVVKVVKQEDLASNMAELNVLLGV